MTLDVAAVRAHFPALAAGVAHFDGPGGSQVPDVVAEAVAATLTAPIANRGRVTAGRAQRRRRRRRRPGRRWPTCSAADPGGDRLRPQHDPADLRLSRALAKRLGPGRRGRGHPARPRREHPALGAWPPRPRARPSAGPTSTRRPASSTAATIAAVLAERTRLVAVTGASNLIGTRPDVAAIAALAHDAGALLYVDGVHLTAHAPVDVAALGADFFACSPYKFLGPHCGVLAGRAGAAGDAAPGQAAAVDRRRARAVRAGHAALRAAGRHHGRGRLPRRRSAAAGRAPRRRAAGRGDDRAGGARGRAAASASRTGWRSCPG